MSGGKVFGQIAFDDAVSEYADAVSKELSFLSDYGLSWSTPYIGQLIGHPVHWGVGLFTSITFTSNEKIAQMAEQIGQEASESPVAKGKQWFPNYAVAVRLGGLGEIPLDFGFKFSYIPAIALWGDLKYHVVEVGGDFHYALFRSEDTGPVITLGAAFDYVEGGADGALKNNTGLSASAKYQSFTSGGGTAVNVDDLVTLYWQSTQIKVRFMFGQPIWVSPFTVFAGLDAGYHISKAGVLIGENKDTRYEDLRDISGIHFSSYGGMAVELGLFRIDLAMLVNFINFELGFGLGFRYQS